jgi:hypothetical protein
MSFDSLTSMVFSSSPGSSAVTGTVGRLSKVDDRLDLPAHSPEERLDQRHPHRHGEAKEPTPELVEQPIDLRTQVARSPFAEMAPTLTISSRPETDASAPLCRPWPPLMPRLRSIEFMSAAIALSPSRMIDLARTVNLVVPLPTRSPVFMAASRSTSAPACHPPLRAECGLHGRCQRADGTQEPLLRVVAELD